jgi:hypothetical protein
VLGRTADLAWLELRPQTSCASTSRHFTARSWAIPSTAPARSPSRSTSTPAASPSRSIPSAPPSPRPHRRPSTCWPRSRPAATRRQRTSEAQGFPGSHGPGTLIERPMVDARLTGLRGMGLGAPGPKPGRATLRAGQPHSGRGASERARGAWGERTASGA